MKHRETLGQPNSYYQLLKENCATESANAAQANF
jgi:hypothetical protein